MRRFAIIWLGVLAVAVGRVPAALAQDVPPEPAVLIADDVYMEGNERLVATGNVEAIYDGRRLQAEGIVYDRTQDRLILTGPIVIREGEETLILASSGEIDQDMQNGILRGARIVMRDHVQLAARELNRSGGRFNQLVKVSVTSCRVCETGRPPLWQIRARRVIHDQQERQLYFEDAQLRVLDTPVFYLPRLRLPDPTLERATGFLVPSLYNSSLLGIGARVPYFIRIGDDKDLTVTPFLTTKTRTLELRYRQAFRNGRIEFEGAVSDDDIANSGRRGYLFGEGEFDLRNDFKLRFDIEAVNDKTYLLDYSYYEKDRLDSEIELERVRRDSYMRGAITYFRSLRTGEINSTLPTLVGNAEWERRLHPAGIGGELRLGMLAHSHERSSGLVIDGVDADTWADGRDVMRLTFSAEWQRGWTLPGGILASFSVGATADHFEIQQAGLTSRSSATEFTPTTELELRWPLLNATAGGATHVVEPVVQLAWAGGSNPFIPNDESTRIEFDEGNLFSTSRFTAPDRRERGLSAAYGLSWTRFAPSGLQTSLAVGQLVRDEQQIEPATGLDIFSSSSGLNGKVSDMLLAGQVRTGGGLVLTARGLFDDSFDTTKAEARAAWYSDKGSLGATYIWLGRDPAENRAATISEWNLDASYRLSQHWTGSANWRYDVVADDSVRAGIGLTYLNECVEISLTASRRFTSSAVLSPSTDISLTVGLRGFTTKTGDESYARTCND